MNLLMVAPLCDSRGKIRYFIGAQVDVSGMVKECTDLESLQRLVVEQQSRHKGDVAAIDGVEKKDEFQQLSEMLNMGELDTVRRWGGRMHREHQDDDDDSVTNAGLHKPRLLLKDPSPDLHKTFHLNSRVSGRLSGVYQHVSCHLGEELKETAPGLPLSSTCSFDLPHPYASFSHHLRSVSLASSSLLSWIRLAARLAFVMSSPVPWPKVVALQPRSGGLPKQMKMDVIGGSIAPPYLAVTARLEFG